jgi:hypothetical protein
MSEPNTNNNGDDNTNKSTSQSLVKHQFGKDFNATIQQFEKIKEVAEYLATSDAFTTGFEQKKDGKSILDETTGKPKINVTDVAVCLMVGNELGLDLGGSLVLGKKLNRNTYLSILKGRELGVGVATSMEKIYSIETKNGNTISYTGVDIISAKLNQGGVEFTPFIKDYAPVYEYSLMGVTPIVLSSDEVEDIEGNIDLKKFFIYRNTSTPAEITAAKSSGKLIISRKEIGKITTIKFVRTFKNGNVRTHIQSYTTMQAQVAGLLPTKWAQDGTPIGGKDNWITNPSGMLANRTITKGGRIIGADLINGIYSEDEAREIIDTFYTEAK